MNTADTCVKVALAISTSKSKNEMNVIVKKNSLRITIFFKPLFVGVKSTKSDKRNSCCVDMRDENQVIRLGGLNEANKEH